ncbi:MAG: diphthine--ammonia ligase [Methanobacteriota archaeon]|nr:MAG: diphthine--ammonia ligase [Euryarchaeota archaeon]
MAQRVSALFSGGKDSAYAVFLLQQQGWKIVSLLTVIPRDESSYMFHHPNAQWTALQSEAMGIPLKTVESNADEEKELDDLETLMWGEDVEGFLCGAIASDYQWSRINDICHKLARPLYSPLWRKPQRGILEDMLDADFRIIIVGTYAEGLDDSWLGLEITHEVIGDLTALQREHGINISGEGGEIETFVIDAPIFSGPIEIERADKIVSRDSATYAIRNASIGRRELSDTV